MRVRGSGVALAFALVLTAAGCGSDRTASTEVAASTTSSVAAVGDTTLVAPASDSTVASTDPAVPDVAQFGDLAWPCGPGDGANTDDGSEPGVTATSVSIAAGDDAGYATAPGLNKEMTEAVQAFAAKCNELGGINGRQITVNYYDAAIVNIAQAIQSACDDGNFFLVGEGWSLDSGQEDIRTSCGLPAVPAYSVSAAFGMARDVFQSVPNPADEIPSLVFKQFAELLPEAVTKVATLGGNFSATQETIAKVRAAAPKYGWTFVDPPLEYDIFSGVTDWTPMVKQILDLGATSIVWAGACLPNLQKFVQTAKQNGLDVPILTDSNHYETACAAANVDGSLDNVYLRFATVPFEDASVNKATQDYLDLMDAAGGGVSLLGTAAASGFLMWATAASECGAQLTRPCVVERLSNLHEWTGGGLHAPSDPGGNHPPDCIALFKLSGTTYERVAPVEPGTFECDPSAIETISGTPALEALNLDADRHPQN